MIPRNVAHAARRLADRRALSLAILLAAPACGDQPTGPPLEPFLAEIPDHFVLVHQDDRSAVLAGTNDLVANLVVSERWFEEFRTVEWTKGYSMAVANLVFASRFPDAFDFLIVTFDPDRPRTALPVGSHARVRIDVEGLGYPLGGDGYRYGATRRLRSVVMLREVRNLRDGPSLHELAHHWGATLLPTVSFGHWGLAGVGGQLGGWAPGSLEEIEPGLYRGYGPTGMVFHTVANGGNRVPYAPLELYMMGFLAPDSVAPVEVAVGGEVVDELEGTFTAESIQLMDMDEILRGLGPRDPSWLEAPRQFRVLYVVLTAEAPLDVEELEALANDVREFARPEPDDRDDVFNFWEATGGRATLRFDGLIEAAERGY